MTDKEQVLIDELKNKKAIEKCIHCHYDDEGIMVAKTCPKCNITKPIVDFNRDKTKKDGLNIYCKSCVLENQKMVRVREKLGIAKSATSTRVKGDPLGKKLELEAQQYIDEAINGPLLTMPNIQTTEVVKQTKQEVQMVINDNMLVDISNKLMAEHDEDLKKSDEIYSLFYDRIATGVDNTQGAKEALTKAVELRIISSQNLAKVMEVAVKLIDKQNKAKPQGNNFNINIANLKNMFGEEDEE